MNIFIEPEERKRIIDGINAKYEEFMNSDSLTYPQLVANKVKDNFDGLVLSFESELKEYFRKPDIRRNALGLPRQSFFVKLYNEKEADKSFRSGNLNACYLYAFGKTREEYLKPTKVEDSFDLGESMYSVRLANYDDIRKIFNIASTVYSGIDVMPYELMLAWYMKNPCCLYVIEDEYGEVVGNMDILPIKPKPLKSFLSGKIIERDLNADALWGIHEKDQIDSLYIESVVNLAGRASMVALLKKFSEIVANFGCHPKAIKRIYCISASPKGQKLITRLGFRLLAQASNRRDKHDVFEADVVAIFRAVHQIFSGDIHYKEHADQLLKQLQELEGPTL